MNASLQQAAVATDLAGLKLWTRPRLGGLLRLGLLMPLAWLDVAGQELLTNGNFAARGDGRLAPGWFDASYGLTTPPEFEVVQVDERFAQRMTVRDVPPDRFACLAQALPTGQPGLLRFRARLKADRPLPAEVQVRLAPAPYTTYGRQQVTVTAHDWTEVRGFARVPPVQNAVWLMILLRQPGTLHVADASVQGVNESDLSAAERQEIERRFGPDVPAVDEARLLADTEARILQARTGPLTIAVLNAAGQPVPNAPVKVEHVRHRFYFGAGFDQRLLPQPNESEVDQRHRQAFLRLFNYATVHLYWGGYEPKEGEPQHEARLRAAQWLKEHGLTPRGHPIFWNHDHTIPRWVTERDPAPDELRRLWDRRLAQMSATILPALHDADVFNEVTHWERFKNPLSRLLVEQGKVEVVTHYLKETKRLNPRLLTVVNDYDSSVEYYALLRRLLDAGAPMDIIGQQTHMHGGNWSWTHLWTVLERLSRLQRPVLFTEHSVLSGPRKTMDWVNRVPDWNTDPAHEQEQADYLETFYRLAYSHSNCLGIVLWNYSDRGAWLGAPVGLLRRDGTPKPSFERLDALINHRWRTRGEFVTDDRGRVTIPQAFEGAYRVQSGVLEAQGEHSAARPLRLPLRP